MPESSSVGVDLHARVVWGRASPPVFSREQHDAGKD